MADVRQYAPGQIEAGIAEAIRARDFPAVVSLLKMLATVDPHRAGVVYGAMLAVLDGHGREVTSTARTPHPNAPECAPVMLGT